MSNDSPFELKKREEVYSTPFLKVYRDSIVVADGSEHVYSWASPNDGVSIVALNSDDEVYLLKEYKYATDKYVWSIPAGGIDDNESPLDTAKRELLEEVGLQSVRWVDLGYYYPSPGTYKQSVFTFLAQDVKEEAKPDHESTTEIEIRKVKFDKAIDMIYENEITDSFAIVALFKAKQVLKSIA